MKGGILLELSDYQLLESSAVWSEEGGVAGINYEPSQSNAALYSKSAAGNMQRR
jgi:hypothetical protein